MNPMQIQRDDLILPGAPPREGGAAHVPTASRARLPQSAKGQLLWKRGTALPRPGGEGAPLELFFLEFLEHNAQLRSPIEDLI